VLGGWLALMVSEVFSNLNDSMVSRIAAVFNTSLLDRSSGYAKRSM